MKDVELLAPDQAVEGKSFQWKLIYNFLLCRPALLLEAAQNSFLLGQRRKEEQAISTGGEMGRETIAKALDDVRAV
jgi:hypothetical protein